MGGGSFNLRKVAVLTLNTRWNIMQRVVPFIWAVLLQLLSCIRLLLSGTDALNLKVLRQSFVFYTFLNKKKFESRFWSDCFHVWWLFFISRSGAWLTNMGRIFLQHIGGTRVFSCASCDTQLTNRSELISTRFTGKQSTFHFLVNDL